MASTGTGGNDEVGDEVKMWVMKHPQEVCKLLAYSVHTVGEEHAKSTLTRTGVEEIIQMLYQVAVSFDLLTNLLFMEKQGIDVEKLASVGSGPDTRLN